MGRAGCRTGSPYHCTYCDDHIENPRSRMGLVVFTFLAQGGRLQILVLLGPQI
jgi:hypothetical protein